MGVRMRNKKVVDNVDKSVDNFVLKKVIALLLIFVVCCGVTTEVLMFGMYILPALCVKLFQITGISIESGMKLAKFPMQDFCVMFMMWILPCLFLTGISIYVHAKLVVKSARYVVRWFRFLFKRKGN